MLKHFKISLVLFLFLLLVSANKAQTFGFGCLGFVGGYGGFTYQKYDATGLNKYMKEFNQTEYVNTPVGEFSYALGYRFGLNFFRATFQNGIILTAKGFYQFIDKKNKGSVGITEREDNYTVDLDLKNWAIGFDVGWELTKVVSWKILDGSLNFNNVTLTETTDLAGAPTDIKKYKSDSGVIGYSIGTGIIVAIIKDYISIEGHAGYTYLVIDNVYDENGVSLLNPSSPNFIDSGGFSTIIQLNVGFPLL